MDFKRQFSVAVLLKFKFLLGTALLLGCCGAANAVTPMVTVGYSHAIGLGSDGMLYGWGDDSYGQLGLGVTATATTPQIVPGLNLGQGAGMSRVASNGEHNLTVKSDGSVWAWGVNTFGQLGDGTTTNRSLPVQVPGLTGVVAVAAGYDSSFALKSDGSVWTWGLGSTGISNTPTQMPELSGAVAVAAGVANTYVVKSDGSVWAWGDNSSGQLGDGTTTYRFSPIQVPGLSGVVAVAVGLNSVFAVKSDGSVWAWGSNTLGQLGDGTKTNRSSPAQVQGLSGAVAVAAGYSNTYVVKSDGSVWAWGLVGVGTMPAQVPGLTGVVAVTTISGGVSSTFAVKSDGSVWTWGDNSSGQLGDGTTTNRSSPVRVPGLTGVVAVAAGGGTLVGISAFAIKSDGSIWSWGSNSNGLLGNGTILNRSSPVQVSGLTGVVAVATGGGGVTGGSTFAVKSDGSVWAWGDNTFSQLGDGTKTNRSSPVQVPGLAGVVTVATGAYSTVALKSNGSVWAWSIAAGNTTPAQVPGLAGVVAVAAGELFGLAVKSDGSVWAWGDNTAGQLGDGTTASHSSPKQVPGLAGVATVVAGASSAIALKSNGSVWVWGLGSSTTPTQVPGLAGVVAVATGFYGNSILALKPDGSVWTWDLGSSTTPTQVPGLAGVVAVAAEFQSTFVLKSDGSIWAWGDNSFGQLGDGTYAYRASPVLVANPTLDGFLSLTGAAVNAPPGTRVPFFVSSTGGISKTTATVNTTTKFNSSDVGKPGAVYVTAMVPPGSDSALGIRSKALATPNTKPFGAPTTASVLMQLTPSGWQQVVNGQLIPYASGVLGDQLAAQSILNNTDTTNLKGAQFCLGYGASATNMTGTGKMRVVATIPNTGANLPSCLPVSNSQLFAYAAANYSNLFSGVATGGTYQQYDYQHYSSTQNYLAVDNAGMIYIMGPASGGAIEPVGAVSSFADIIYAWQAAQPH